MKVLLTLIVLAVLVLVVMSISRTWQGRRPHRAHVLAPFPQPPVELTGPDGAALLPAASGVYAGTSMAGDWQDQVEVGDIGVQATATLHLSGAGLLIDRAGATPLWIPTESMRGARTGRSIAARGTLTPAPRSWCARTAAASTARRTAPSAQPWARRCSPLA